VLLSAARALLLLCGLAAAGGALAADRDGDGVQDAADNCPFTANPEQGDANDDELGDACQCGDVNGDDGTPPRAG
jgi:hypothetical protein